MSLANGIIAGLSDKYVATTPAILAPGKPHIGLIRPLNILLTKDITPNSESNALSAPARTAIAIIKNTVSNKSACAVLIITLNIIPAPMMLPTYPNPTANSTINTKVSILTALTLLLSDSFSILKSSPF